MNKQKNNKVLLLVLLALAGIFAITHFSRNTTRSEALPSQLLTIDTASISAITIAPSKGDTAPLKFTKNGADWLVEQADKKSSTQAGVVTQLINELHGLKPDRLASRSTEKWSDYSLSDSAATRITVSGGGTTTDLYIGKFSYQQPQGGMPQYGGNRGISGLTYLRMGTKPEVYAVKGFLAMSINRGFDSWRKSDFLKLDKAAVTHLTFNYPADSSFTVVKADSTWRMGDQTADSKHVESFLSSIANKQVRNFADDFTTGTKPDYTLTVSGNSMPDITVQCWADTAGMYYLRSSLNDDAYFSSDASGVFKDIFVGENRFSGN